MPDVVQQGLRDQRLVRAVARRQRRRLQRMLQLRHRLARVHLGATLFEQLEDFVHRTHATLLCSRQKNHAPNAVSSDTPASTRNAPDHPYAVDTRAIVSPEMTPPRYPAVSMMPDAVAAARFPPKSIDIAPARNE